MTKIVLQILLYLLNVSSTNVEEEIKKTSKLVSCSDYKDLANKNMEDTIISYNSPKDILKDYLEVSLYTKVEVLEVIDDDGVKFEKKKRMCEGTISELHRNKKYNIKYGFFFSIQSS
jgi:hypothetical protein